MINFREELMKYNPVLEVDDVEKSIKSDEINDIFDVLQYLSKKIKNDKE